MFVVAAHIMLASETKTLSHISLQGLTRALRYLPLHEQSVQEKSLGITGPSGNYVMGKRASRVADGNGYRAGTSRSYKSLHSHHFISRSRYQQGRNTALRLLQCRQ